MGEFLTEYRPGSPDDYLLAAEMRQEMAIELEGDWDAEHPGWRQRFADYFARRQAAGRAQLFMAVESETPIGMAIVSIADHYRAETQGISFGYVNGVYVKPMWRRRGIGRHLMDLAIRWARGRGCATLRLRSSDEGRALYEALGFRPSSEMQLRL